MTKPKEGEIRKLPDGKYKRFHEGMGWTDCPEEEAIGEPVVVIFPPDCECEKE